YTLLSIDYSYTLSPSHSSDNLFSFTDPSTPQTYTLSLHDALPISGRSAKSKSRRPSTTARTARKRTASSVSASSARRSAHRRGRSEEHTSELQSRGHLVCRLLLEKKKLTCFSSTQTR